MLEREKFQVIIGKIIGLISICEIGYEGCQDDKVDRVLGLCWRINGRGLRRRRDGSSKGLVQVFHKKQ